MLVAFGYLHRTGIVLRFIKNMSTFLYKNLIRYVEFEKVTRHLEVIAHKLEQK